MLDQYIDIRVLTLFVPTFFAVSATPGLCMTLALGLGMSIGFRRTLWMMAGELVGVALVAVSAVLGVSALMLSQPLLFTALKICGAAYLLHVALRLWRSPADLSLKGARAAATASAGSLALQGFFTAVGNPKGWAFMVALLPGFINTEKSLAPQLTILIGLFLAIEASCLVIYAAGGRTLSRFLTREHHLRNLNRCAALLMAGVAIWLFIS